MTNTMRNSFLGLLLVVIVISGCSKDPENLNGRLVMDSDGNVYEVISHLGYTYFLTKKDPAEHEEYEKLKSIIQRGAE
ncbi:MAG: hypothetical protein ACU843_12820 [Gammaproteobacteria bacterium]